MNPLFPPTLSDLKCIDFSWLRHVPSSVRPRQDVLGDNSRGCAFGANQDLREAP